MKMNKQELAAKIWAGANELRGKVSASDYKDYMLSFIFYKFLSRKEEKYVREKLYFEDSDFEKLTEENSDVSTNCQNNLGYFIAYNNLFSYWIEHDTTFQIADVRTALSAFNRKISKNYKRVYSGIFDSLDQGLNSLGSIDSERSKAVRKLIALIDEIPVDSNQDYDVLGFVYEFLLKNFAANAGKAGEFYTPYEAATIMSEIIAEHLKDRETIKIYDPTSGSGSLLINVGKSISKHLDNPDKIQYYAQELIPNTYNLTRMNLIMRGILPNNIIARNGDTLADDWPFFDDNDKERTYDPVFVDACTSNPPYSNHWDTDDASTDPRFADYGIAPSSKADYAFLLHNLYHLKSDGIMTIVLPHGVLFRGGPNDNSEGSIRKKLIDKNCIEAIIGLPANCFFGTGIPTIIMVLKKNRTEENVLFIDASKGFIKDGNKNRLRAKDVRKIVDTVISRKSIDKYSRLVSKKEIQDNQYNLNIPRYVDSSEKEDYHDIYATMFGGIPNYEIDELKEYWKEFPSLKDELFAKKDDIPYSVLASSNISDIINNNKDVIRFKNNYLATLKDLPDFLNKELIENAKTLSVNKEEKILSEKIRESMNNTSDLIDYYDAYQILDDKWAMISSDLEAIQTDGLSCITEVEDIMVTKKKAKTEEVYDVLAGYKGRILPFDLIQEVYFKNEKDELDNLNNELSTAESEKESLIEGIDPEDMTELLKDDGESLDNDKLKKKIAQIKTEVDDGEIGIINKYIRLLDRKANKSEKLDFIKNHSEVNWNNIEASKDGTYSKTNANKYISTLFESYEIEDDDFKNALLGIERLNTKISKVKKEVKSKDEVLQNETKAKIESLSQDEAIERLKDKWITPLCSSINNLVDLKIKELQNKLYSLSKKYEITMNDVDSDLDGVESSLKTMIDDLTGPSFDMQGLEELKKLLGGKDEQ